MSRNWQDPKYKKWRLDVYRRDKFRCRWPNCSCKKHINAHHILNWAEYPLLRFEVDNGITLCKRHHTVVTGQEDKYVQFLIKLLPRKRKRYR